MLARTPKHYDLANIREPRAFFIIRGTPDTPAQKMARLFELAQNPWPHAHFPLSERALSEELEVARIATPIKDGETFRNQLNHDLKILKQAGITLRTITACVSALAQEGEEATACLSNERDSCGFPKTYATHVFPPKPPAGSGVLSSGASSGYYALLPNDHACMIGQWKSVAQDTRDFDSRCFLEEDSKLLNRTFNKLRQESFIFGVVRLPRREGRRIVLGRETGGPTL